MSDIDEEILVIDEENADEKNATNSHFQKKKMITY